MPPTHVTASTGLVVALVIAVGAAYVLAHFVVDRLQRRFLVLSGFEYVALGVALGPALPGARVFGDLEPILPVIALAAGWVGLLRGMELDLGQVRAVEQHRTRLALSSSVSAGLVCGGVAWWALRGPAPAAVGLGAIDAESAAMAAGFLACAAASGSVGPFDVVAQRYSLVGETAALLRRAVRLGDVVALFVFGVLICVFHPQNPGAPLVLRPTEWVVVSVLLGAALGLLFRYFLGEDDSENGRFLALVGIITFASGAAYLLELSPLMVNLVLGAVLVNADRGGARIRETLERTELPMALVLRLFAGALLSIDRVGLAALAVAAFVLLRVVGKAAGTAAAASGVSLRRDLYRGQLGHGDVTVAMAISYRLVFDGPLAELAYAVALGAVVVSDLVAPRALRGLLIEAGELRAEAGYAHRRHRSR